MICVFLLEGQRDKKAKLRRCHREGASLQPVKVTEMEFVNAEACAQR
jgi:hypothetical protein